MFSFSTSEKCQLARVERVARYVFRSEKRLLDNDEMARPRKQLHEKRTASIRVSLTQAEKLFVQDQAETAGLSEAEYTRRRLLKNPVRVPRARINAQLLHKLNQLTLQLHHEAQDSHIKPSIPALAGHFTELIESLALNEY